MKISSTCPPSSGEGDTAPKHMEQNIHGLLHQTVQSSDLRRGTHSSISSEKSPTLSESQIPHLFLMKFKERLICSALFPIFRKQQ